MQSQSSQAPHRVVLKPTFPQPRAQAEGTTSMGHLGGSLVTGEG
jgi:hypothetical protein